jgi:hypothetical protein
VIKKEPTPPMTPIKTPSSRSLPSSPPILSNDFTEARQINMQSRANGSSKFLKIAIWNIIGKSLNIVKSAGMMRPEYVKEIFKNSGKVAVQTVVRGLRDGLLNNLSDEDDFRRILNDYRDKNLVAT